MKLFIALFLIIGSYNAYSQCPTTLLSEDFNTGPIIGEVGSNLTGPAGPNDDIAYTFDGTPYGWFNVSTGLADVDVYDRHFDACLSSEITISLSMRMSTGAPMDIDLIVKDDFGVTLTTTNVVLGQIYEMHRLTFRLPSTTGFNFIIHSVSAGADAGREIIAEDLLIQMYDNIAPTASSPLPINVSCVADIPVADVAVITDAMDNCSVPTVTFLSDVSDGASCPETITRTYAVTDECGNTLAVTQMITVNDIISPTGSNPSAITVSCASDVPAPDPTVVTDAADNCGVPTVTFISDTSDGDVCNLESISRIYAITDACGNSINVTQIINIEVITPSVDAGLDQALCEGSEVTLTAFNPDGAAISWTPIIADGIAFVPGIGTTNYSVTAAVCGGECIQMDDVDVVVNPLPVVDFFGDNLFDCPEHIVNYTNLSSESFRCSWNFGDGSISNICGPVTHTYNSPGIYDVTLRVESAEGCVAELSRTDYIETLPSPVAAFSFQSSDIDALDPEVNFINESALATDVTWNFGDGSGEVNDINPIHIYPFETGGTYDVELTATNDANCISIAEKSITIKDVVLYYVPNAFTPDNDGFNADFKPVFTSGYDVYDYHLLIFNQYGEVVFESFDSFYGWDGSYGGSGLCQSGVYVWQVDFGLLASDEKKTDRGTFTLLR
ncbi:PKD domain-containing protein [Crocinitomix catalasitica]|uniref:PKD domain-containing protein n=1 Tax=Crocinitomix catalasitica TaxID=184607 RepID=UPI0004803463|nr:PKD domain-containing protein [Crocinitomix catalasitica]